MAEPLQTATALNLRQLGKSSGITMARQSLAMVVAFASSVVLARLLGPEGRGIFSVALLLPITAITLFNLGIGPASVYFIARGAYSPAEALRNNLVLGTLISLVAVAVGALVIHWGAGLLFPGVPHAVLYVSLIYIPFGLLARYLLAIVQGLQAFGAYNLIALASQLAGFVLSIMLVWLLGLGVNGALLALAAGQAVEVVSALYALRAYRVDSPGAALGPYVRALLPYGLATNVNRMVDFAVRHADLFLVNLYLGPSEAGIYVLAMALAERLSIVSASPAIVMLPRISALEGSDDVRLQLTPVITRHVLWSSLALSLLALALASVFVEIIYGPAFQRAAVVFQVVLPGTVLLSAAHVLASDVAGRGRPQVNARISLAGLATTLALDIALIPTVGILGAGWAFSIASAVSAILTLVYYCRSSRVPCTSVIFLTRSDLERLGRVMHTQLITRLRAGRTPEGASRGS
jgi:O-antigen/teichoic acid export membrane protein